MRLIEVDAVQWTATPTPLTDCSAKAATSCSERPGPRLPRLSSGKRYEVGALATAEAEAPEPRRRRLSRGAGRAPRDGADSPRVEPRCKRSAIGWGSGRRLTRFCASRR